MGIKGIILHKQFEKSYARQKENIRLAFKKRLSLFIDNPHHPSLKNHGLHGEWADYASINITGDIRAIYKIDDEVAIFVAIGSHGELYE